MHNLNSLRDLLIHYLKVIYDAEEQYTEILPLVAERATHPDLQKTINDQLNQGKQIKKTLITVGEQLAEDHSGQISEAMMGLTREMRFFFNEDFDNHVADAGLINLLQRATHYCIAGYGAMSNYADQLNEEEIKNELGQLLDMKKKLDDELKQLALHINEIAV